jgi:hypothetical protein
MLQVQLGSSDSGPQSPSAKSPNAGPQSFSARSQNTGLLSPSTKPPNAGPQSLSTKSPSVCIELLYLSIYRIIVSPLLLFFIGLILLST